MKNMTIYEALEASASTKDDNHGNTYLEIPSCSSPDIDYWTAAKQYAEKSLKPMLLSGKTAMLNTALGYDAATNDDLIEDAILKFGTRYPYFVQKFNTINAGEKTRTEKIAEFNRIVSTTIPTMLSDAWRRISEETEYTEVDSDGNTCTKTGKGVRQTHSAISLFANQNRSTDHVEDEIALIDCIPASGIDLLKDLESSDFILNCISQLKDCPRQMMGFMAMHSDVSSNDILGMLQNGNSSQVIFHTILTLFAFQYQCPELLARFKNSYSESQLTYSGSMNLKKVLDKERSQGKKKIKTYIEKEYSYKLCKL